MSENVRLCLVLKLTEHKNNLTTCDIWCDYVELATGNEVWG